MSKITKDTHATLHQLVAGEDTIKEQARLEDLVLRYISLTSSQRPEYFITIGQVEYLPKQMERWARDFDLIWHTQPAMAGAGPSIENATRTRGCNSGSSLLVARRDTASAVQTDAIGARADMYHRVQIGRS
jgi:hypothetical protein